MKKLTSEIIRILYIVSSICIVPLAVLECYEIISGSAAVDPHLRNMVDGLFWTAFAVYHLCSWYINRRKNTPVSY